MTDTSNVPHLSPQAAVAALHHGYGAADEHDLIASQTSASSLFPAGLNYVTTSEAGPHYMGMPTVSRAPSRTSEITHPWQPTQEFAQPAATIPDTSGLASPALHAFNYGIPSSPIAALASPYQRIPNFAFEEMQMAPQQLPFQHASHYVFASPPPQASQPQTPRSLPDVRLHPPTFDYVTSAPSSLSRNVMTSFQGAVDQDDAAGDLLGWADSSPAASERVIMPAVDSNYLQPSPSTFKRSLSPTSTETSSSHTSVRSKRWPVTTMPPTPTRGGFVCDCCNMGFRAQGDLTHHLRCHQPYRARAHGCEHCGKRFQYRKDLIRHLPRHDPNARRFHCPHEGCKYATKGFGRRDHLDRHIGTQHRVDTPQQLDAEGPAADA